MKKRNTSCLLAIGMIGMLAVLEGAHAMNCVQTSAGVMLPQGITVVPNPQHTKFAFDLHHVVIEWNPTFSMFKEHVLKPKNAFLFLNLFNVPLMLRFARLLYGRSTGDQYVLLFEKGHQTKLAQLVRAIANEQRHIQGTVAILKDLAAMGYEIDIASNIGKHHLQSLSQQQEHKALFDLFAQKYVVDYQKEPVIQKPYVEYFELYLKRHNQAGKTVIFVDDNIHNVKAAVQTGIIGIHFKNPQQLEHALQSLGILYSDMLAI